MCVFLAFSMNTTFFFFLEIGLFYHSPRVKQLGFYHFLMYSDDFLIFRRISVNRQVLVSLNGFENSKTQLFNSEGVVK